MFGGLGQIGLPKVSVELVDKLTPVIMNQQFVVCNQNQLPPKHGDVGEVSGSIKHLLTVSHKLVRLAVKGHNTADDERA